MYCCGHSWDEAEDARNEAAESDKDKCDKEAGEQGIHGELGGAGRGLVGHHHGSGLGHHLRGRGRRGGYKSGEGSGRRGCGQMWA